MDKLLRGGLAMLLAAALLLGTGCEKREAIPEEAPTTVATVTEAPTETTIPPETAEGLVRVACVGDSITYGHGISSRSENSYPAVLGSLLGEGYQVENFGDPGSAVQGDSDQPYRERELYGESLAFDPDIIVFMLGTNDSKEDNWFGEAAFRQELEGLLDSYGEGEAQPEIYLCTPASAFFLRGHRGPETDYEIRPAEVDRIAEILRQVARERGLPLIDIHALTAENPQWFSEDGVHPDKAGAKAIAQAVYEALTLKQ